MRKFKTLNNKQMTPVKGGGESKISTCTEAGDTYFRAKHIQGQS